LFNVFPQSAGEYYFLSSYFTKCFYEDEKRKVWFGTINGLNIYNREDGSVLHFSPSDHYSQRLPGNIVTAIFKDKRGTILIGHNKGISVFDGKKNFRALPLITRLPPDSASTFIYRIIELKNGNLIAATNRQLLLMTADRCPGYAFTSNFKGSEKLPSTITDIVEIDSSDWFISPLIGLYHASFFKDSLVITEHFLPGIDFRCLHKDESERDILWIASGKGLIRFNIVTKSYKLFAENDGLMNSYVYGILEDEMHRLWLSTNGGVSMFDKHSHEFKNYTWKDGLQSNEFNTGAFYKGPSGMLYFGGVSGFNYFKASGLNNELQQATAVISVSEITVNNKIWKQDLSFQKTHLLRLKYFNNDISFHLAALDFTLPEANKISYKLEGWNNDWIVSYNKNILYSNLPPGSYTFRAKAANADGRWGREESISIIISSPFWKTWWFYSLVALVIVSEIIWITGKLARRRLKQRLAELEQQRQIDKERLRISREMHDDIGAGLTQITLMSESVKLQVQKEQKVDLEEIADTSRQLVSNMGEIIWSLNPEYKTLDDLMNYLRESLHKLLEHSGIGYSILLPENGGKILLSNEQRRNILLVAKEIVNNAIKYSFAKNILVKGELQDLKLLFEISDNGLGFDTKAIGRGNGLRNIRDRIKEMRGELRLASAPGRGSNFYFTIPLSH
jgi:signal transduction histidine kinase